MKTALTYDVSDKHPDFKKELMAIGYADTISGYTADGKAVTMNLPNTTLVHLNKTPQQANKDAEGLAATLSIVLERCMAFEFSSYWGRIGYEHTS